MKKKNCNFESSFFINFQLCGTLSHEAYHNCMCTKICVEKTLALSKIMPNSIHKGECWVCEMWNSSDENLKHHAEPKLDVMSIYKNCSCQACYWKWHITALHKCLFLKVLPKNCNKEQCNIWCLVTYFQPALVDFSFSTLVPDVLGFKKKVIFPFLFLLYKCHKQVNLRCS